MAFSSQLSLNNYLTSKQIRASPLRSRVVRVNAASPMGSEFQEPEEKTGIQQYLTEAVRHVFQTDNDKSLKWKSTSYSGKVSRDDHAKLRKLHFQVSSTVKAVENSEKPDDFVPLSSKDSWQSYLTGAIESVFSSKDIEVKEPNWKAMPFEGDIAKPRDIRRLYRVESVIRDTIESSNPDKH